MLSAILAALVILILFSGYAVGSAVTATAANTASGSGPNNETGVVVSNSDQSLTGSFITQDVNTWPGASPSYPNGQVWNICTAVALAEGFNLGPGTAPYDLNNPGDLSPGDESGQATSGLPQIHDGSAIVCFATCEGGFIALYTKFQNIANGASRVYPASYTWAQVAAKYAGNSAAWLNNVTSYLGVNASSTPASYVNG